MTTRKWYDLYVDGAYLKTVKSGWGFSRMLAHLNRKHPDAKSLEVRLHEDGSSLHRFSFRD